MSGQGSCRVCGGGVREAFRHLVLQVHRVVYMQCTECGLLQTETPYWLEEAYASPIAARDTGVLYRNLRHADLATALFWKLHRGKGRYLDAAGGYGIFTRLMRDIGFDYYWSDRYSPNLLARGFEADIDGGEFTAVTAFEVLEHLTDPVGFLSDLVGQTACRTLLTSTETFAGTVPSPQWWYYSFNTGQHITFYTPQSLRVIARRLGFALHQQRNVQLWTRQSISTAQFRFCVSSLGRRWMSGRARRRLVSRIQSDSQQL